MCVISYKKKCHSAFDYEICFFSVTYLSKQVLLFLLCVINFDYNKNVFTNNYALIIDLFSYTFFEGIL